MKNHEPKSFVQGESLLWARCFADYPASGGWAVTYYFRGAGTGFDAAGAAGGDDFTFSVPGTTTAAMTKGQYSFQAFAVKGSEKVLVASGTVEVAPSLSTIAAGIVFDGRSDNKKTLDAIRAMIAGKATHDQQEYAIGNRQLKRIPVTDLIALESHYAQKVAREKQAENLKKGGGFFKQVHIRMK